MLTTHLRLNILPQPSESKILSASFLSLNLPRPPGRFFRHGWQSWALTTWLDPTTPPIPVRAAEFRLKDEDAAYALSKYHVSAWVGAVELGDDDILLLGALGLGGRVKLEESTLTGFDEAGGRNQWLLSRGTEEEVFSKYVALLQAKFGKGRLENAPRVWCSWYSLYGWINERILLQALDDFGDMPFDVFQIDDGWQLAYGDWLANHKFPSGMESVAEQIAATGRIPGLWLAPFMVSAHSQLAKDHPDWLLRDENGIPVQAGITWSGHALGLDSCHPGVLEWLDRLIRNVRGRGYGYLKLDFLYIGALVGKRYRDIPREMAYRNAMQVIRDAAGDAYLLACGAPVIPSLGLCDGLRIGPDVAPFWLNKPLSVWLNNPNDTSTQNAIRTSLHRLWLHPLVNVDPDVVFFRSKHDALQPEQRQLLQDVASISGFKATSDLPQWLVSSEESALRAFLKSMPTVKKIRRYEYQIDGRLVDFKSVIPIPASNAEIPLWLARSLGLLKIATNQALPAIWECARF